MEATIPLSFMPEPYRAHLLSMYMGEPQLGVDGHTHAIDQNTRISLQMVQNLYEICVATKPKHIIEIGVAYGFSTLTFLAAIDTIGGGHLTSIDPFQDVSWKGIGVQHVYSLGATNASIRERFRFIDKKSDITAARFIEIGESSDLIFIDGNHTLDYVMADFFLFEQICQVGGIIIFDDMWMPSIQAATSFIKKNRPEMKEIEIDIPGICIFRKTGHDTRDWNHFVPF